MIATFDRIGGNHSVSPQEIADHVEGGADADADTIAAAIYYYARQFLASKNVDVHVDLDKMEGTIFCGMHVGGHFTLTKSE